MDGCWVSNNGISVHLQYPNKLLDNDRHHMLNKFGILHIGQKSYYTGCIKKKFTVGKSANAKKNA